MIKLVVVEDEALVRQGLVLAVDWAALDCVVVGEAANGEEGLEVILRAQPDFVLTDVRMPRLDGIGMIRQLRAEGCRAEFIILTAYSDFEYAHSAVRLGVADFLLKPFADRELNAAVGRVRDRLASRTAPQEGGSFRFDLEKGAKSKYVEEAVAYLRTHYAENLTIAQAADAISLSEGYLSRLFKKETGYTFNTYLVMYRIHTAIRLLRDRHTRVYEAAGMVGFADTAYISTLFKKYVGVSPSEYQDRCQ